MLRSPYTSYNRLYVYHIETDCLPLVEDQDFIGTWQEGSTIVLFFHRPKDDLIKELCAENSCSVVYQADLDYRDWEAGIDFSIFETEGLTVAPIWDDAEADIKLDPSVIFGSGFHPTTRQCMKSMLALLEETSPSINTVFDLGCGTGLLGIAAAKRGAKTVLSVDYNNLACQVTQKNALLNNMDEIIKVEQMDLTKNLPDTDDADLVMANLHHPLLIKLFSRSSFWKAKYYIFSGFFSSREDELICAMPPDKKLKFLSRHSTEKWGTWVLENTQ